MSTKQSPDHRATVSALVDFLSWKRDDVQLLQTACAAHVRWCFWRLQVVGDSLSQPYLFAEVRALPLVQQQRILLAPAVQRLLGRAPDQESLRALRAFVRREQSLMEGTAGVPGWTALGDYYRTADSNPSSESREWLREAEYRASSAEHLVLDTHCDHNGELIPEEFAQLVPHSASEIETIRDGISRAIGLIRATSRPAAMMIRECARIVRISKAPQTPALNVTHSHRNVIGRIGFINAQNSTRWTADKFANDLVHESVHAMIYKLELQTPLYVDYDAATEMKAVSPWTGRELNLHSFVHACFVWFALCSFWKRANATTDEAQAQQERARSGFLKGNLLGSLSKPVRANIQPYVRDALVCLPGCLASSMAEVSRA